MRLPIAAQQFKIILESLLFISPWTRWLILGGFCLAAVAATLHYLSGWITFAVIAAFGDVAMAVSLFVCAMALPGQLLAINTSRQIGILPGIRWMSLLVLMAFCLALPAGLMGVLWFFDKPVDYIAVFFTALVYLSGIMTLGIVLASRIPMGQNFILIFSWFLFKLAGPLLTLSIVNYLFLLILVWLPFCIWWLRWKPTQYLMNPFGIAHNNAQRWQLELLKTGYGRGWKSVLATGFSGAHWQNHAPGSAVGSVLLGYSDGASDLLKKSAIGVLVYSCLLLFALIKGKLSDVGQFAFGFVYIMYLFTALGLLWAFSRNMRNAWLLCIGSRATLFSLVESTYWRALVNFLGLLAAAHLVSCIVFSEYFYNWQFSLLLLSYSFAGILCAFYVWLIIYVRYGLPPAWFILPTVITMLTSIGLLLVIVNFWPSQPLLSYEVTLGYVVSLLVISVFLRKKALQMWQQVNFRRVYS